MKNRRLLTLNDNIVNNDSFTIKTFKIQNNPISYISF